MSISIQITGLDDFIRGINDFAQRQVPFATAKSLNEVANIAKITMNDEMHSVFDMPTGFTLNSTRVERAMKNHLSSAVGFKDISAARRGHYLEPEVYGGPRRHKPFEARLISRGIMPAGYFAVPGAGAAKDAFGNMSRGQIVQILSFFDAFREAGYGGNMGAAGRGRLRRATRNRYGMAYFVIKPGSGKHLHPGIYNRVHTNFGSSIRPVVIFVSHVEYSRRLDFERITTEAFDENFDRLFAANLEAALNTARPR